MEKRRYFAVGGGFTALVFSVLLALLTLCMPSHARAAQVEESWEVGSPTASDVTATLYGDGSLVFSGTGDTCSYTHMSPDRSPWYNNSLVKSVRFESGVEPSDLNYYFYRCTNLVQIASIPESVTSLEGTFYGCSSLEAAPVIPAGVTSLTSTFDDCSSLKEAPVIPAGVTEIRLTFAGCTSLSKAPVIPDSVTNMFGTFVGCTSLEAAPVIPNNVTAIENAFINCTALKAAPLIPKSVTNMAGAFAGCTSLTKLPDGFELPNLGVMRDGAFYVNLAEGEKPLKIYVNAPADESLLYYDWASDGRELVVVDGAASSWKRLSGNTAIGTMKAVVNEAWGQDSSYKAIVVTNKGYQDALSASGLAGVLSCPILMTSPTSLTDATAEYIAAKRVGKVLVVGGTQAISDDVVNQIEKLGSVKSVERVAGNTAVGTANKIYEYGKKQGYWSWGSDAIVATAAGFQDALSIAPYAYAKKAPIFLASGKPGTLTDGTVKLLKAGGFTRTIVTGGTEAVAASVDKQVTNPTRLAGNTAYGTCRKIADFCLANGMSAEHVGVATGRSYQDALCGAMLLGRKNSILVLVDEKNQSNIANVVKANKSALRGCYIFGGTQAVSTKVENALKAASK